MDVVAASRIVLRDWNTGKFPRYTTPSAGASAVGTSDAVFAELYAKDDEILASLKPRKELRKTSGLVRLETGVADERKVELDAPWIEAPGDADSDEDDEEDEIVAGPGESEDEGDDIDEDDEGEDEGEEENEDEEPVQPHGKRKRGDPAASKAPPAKRVAFAPEPKNTKQARSAAGARGAAVAASRKALRTEAKATKPTKAAKALAKPAPAKKAANAAPAKKATSTGDKSGEEAYDFKKFF